MALSYAKQIIRFGVGGLDLRRSIDLVDPLNAAILTNAVRLPDGGWTARLGQQDLATAATQPLHSIVRGIDVPTGTSNLFWGSGTVLYRGTSSVLSSVATGFSGAPLSLTMWEAAVSGESWVLVGDSTKMCKVRVKDGLVLPIGLPEPATPPVTTVTPLSPGNHNQKIIEDFLDHTTWTGAFAQAGVSNPTTADITPGKGGRATLLQLQTTSTVGVTSCWSAIDKAKTLDLTTFGGGVAAIDDDFVHLWMKFQNPLIVQEVRIYFTTKNATTGISSWASGYLPGVDGVHNVDGYYKAFRPADATPILNAVPTVAVLPTVAGRGAVDDAVKTPIDFNGNDTPGDTMTNNELPTGQLPSAAGAAGAFTWTEWGSVGIPLRRGDFQAFGEPDWANVVGMTIQVLQSTNALTNYQFSDMYLNGGSGLDTSEPGTQKYDYVCSNYDPRTGAEGNASVNALQAEANWKDSLRQSITVACPAGADAGWVQRVYRRGGTIVDNWHFVGQTTTNGGSIIDTLGDTEIVAADSAPTDYFAGVPSINADGTEHLERPMPYIWGPLQGLIFMAGDPQRPGAVYFPYPDSVDQWSADGYVNVCSSTESVIGGFILGSQAFAWGSQRLYVLNINLNDSSSVVGTVTSCTRAPIAPWAFVVGNGGCWFMAYDGVYVTDGGPEINVSDNWVRSLFQGQTVNGLAPIDFSATTAIRMAVYLNELHIFYQDVNGVRNGIVYHLTDKLWRHVYYENAVSCVYADITVGNGELLFGTGAGRGMKYAGHQDLFTPIAVHIRTGAQNQGYQKSFKRYLDYTLDIDAANTLITCTPYSKYNQTAGTALTIPNTETGRQPYISPFAPAPLLSISLGLDISWSNNTAGPILYGAALTFEVEPPTIKSWSSLPTDHGINGWHMATAMYLALRSTATVELTVVTWGQGGTVLNTYTYFIPATGFEKFKSWVPFYATKGAFYSYQLTSVEPFVLYSEESTITVQEWGVTKTQFATSERNVRLIDVLREGTTSFQSETPDAARTPGA